MKFDPQKHHRRSIRLQHYDYTQPGGYFITIVTHNRDLLFGKIVNREMHWNELGKIAAECWRAIPEHFPNVDLGAYVVMPNHVHGIIVINENRMGTNSSPSVGAMHASPLRIQNVKPGSLGAIVGSFKSAVTKRIGRELNATGIWQRNYGACPEPVEGNVSFATMRNGIESTGISKPTRHGGRKIRKIRQHRKGTQYGFSVRPEPYVPHHRQLPL